MNSKPARRRWQWNKRWTQGCRGNNVYSYKQCWGSVTYWCGSGSLDTYLWLMDPAPDPDPTPHPTPFFSDFKDVKKLIFFIIFFLPTGTLSSVLKIFMSFCRILSTLCSHVVFHKFFAKILCSNFSLQALFQLFSEKGEGSGSGSGSVHHTNGSGSGRPKNMRIRIRIPNTAHKKPCSTILVSPIILGDLWQLRMRISDLGIMSCPVREVGRQAEDAGNSEQQAYQPIHHI
jgi:hypothetical protein